MSNPTKKEFHEAREREELEAAERCDDDAMATLHRELAERHRAEAARQEKERSTLNHFGD